MSGMLVAVFLGMLWARVSDVGIAEHALPSLAVPCALGLVGVSLWRRIAAGERLGITTFRRLWPVLPYLLVVTASALWAEASGPALESAVELAKDILIFWVIVELISDTHTLKQCCVVLTLVAGALGALSTYQHATSTFTSSYGGFAHASIRQIVGAENLYRLAGPIGDPNYYALILLVAAPIGLALLKTSMHLLMKVLIVGAVLLICQGVLLTYSRGGTLVLALAIGFSLIRSGMTRPMLAILVVSIPVGIALAPSSVWDRLETLLTPFQDGPQVGRLVDDSVALRIGAQQVALEMFLDHPFGGVGAANYPLLYQDYSRALGVPAVASEFYPHNLYLQVAAETGAAGLVTFLPVVAAPVLVLDRRRRASPTGEWREIATGVEIALVCYLIASLMLHASYPRYFWMLLALAVAAGA